MQKNNFMKNVLTATLLLTTSLSVVSCQGLVDAVVGHEDNPAATNVVVAGVTLDKTELTLNVGETAQLTATVTPENATDKTVIWSSDNTSVATVDATGNVIGVAEGTATITAKAGSKIAGCTVTVKALTALNITNPAVGQIIGDDGKNYDWGTVPEGVTWVARIVKVDGNGHGLALGYLDYPDSEKRMNWADAKTYVEGFTPFAGTTWRLPTMDEWKIILGLGYSPKTGYYWSSTPGDADGKMWAQWIDMDGDGYTWEGQIDMSEEWMVRGCFSF